MEIKLIKKNIFILGDPYHAYYQYKVSEFRDGKAAAESIDPKLVTAPPPPPPPLSLAKNEVVKQRQSELLKQVQKEQEPPPPKDPPPEFEFVADPPSISGFQLFTGPVPNIICRSDFCLIFQLSIWTL